MREIVGGFKSTSETYAVIFVQWNYLCLGLWDSHRLRALENCVVSSECEKYRHSKDQGTPPWRCHSYAFCVLVVWWRHRKFIDVGISVVSRTTRSCTLYSPNTTFWADTNKPSRILLANVWIPWQESCVSWTHCRQNWSVKSFCSHRHHLRDGEKVGLEFLWVELKYTSQL